MAAVQAADCRFIGATDIVGALSAMGVFDDGRSDGSDSFEFHADV